MAGYSIRRLICLFLIQLLNRESALFLAFFLFIAGVLRLILNDRRELAGRECAWGGSLFVAGAALIEILRKTLFIMGPIARAGADLRHRGFENFIIYRKNRGVFPGRSARRLECGQGAGISGVPDLVALVADAAWALPQERPARRLWRHHAALFGRDLLHRGIGRDSGDANPGPAGGADPGVALERFVRKARLRSGTKSPGTR